MSELQKGYHIIETESCTPGSEKQNAHIILSNSELIIFSN